MKTTSQGPGPSPLARSAIDLRAADIERLTEIASAHNSTARAGANYGRPSWRALVKDIATGRLVVASNALATLEFMAPVAVWRGSYAKEHPTHPGEPLVTLSAMDMDGVSVGEELSRGRTLEAAILAL